jgi:hypothetical protein
MINLFCRALTAQMQGRTETEPAFPRPTERPPISRSAYVCVRASRWRGRRPPAARRYVTGDDDAPPLPSGDRAGGGGGGATRAPSKEEEQGKCVPGGGGGSLSLFHMYMEFGPICQVSSSLSTLQREREGKGRTPREFWDAQMRVRAYGVSFLLESASPSWHLWLPAEPSSPRGAGDWRRSRRRRRRR